MLKGLRTSRHIFFWMKYVIAILIFGVSIGFVGENSIINRIEHKREIHELQRKITELRHRFDIENQSLQKLKNDPAEVRRVAREHYFMKKENEDVFIIEDE